MGKVKEYSMEMMGRVGSVSDYKYEGFDEDVVEEVQLCEDSRDIKAFRKKYEINQSDMAKLLGYSSKTRISNIENGRELMSSQARKAFQYVQLIVVHVEDEIDVLLKRKFPFGHRIGEQ